MRFHDERQNTHPGRYFAGQDISLQQQFSQAADISLQRQLSAPPDIGLPRQVTSAQDISFTRQLSTPAPQDLTQQAQQQQYTTNPQYQGPQFWGGCLCRDGYQQQQQQQERSVCDACAFHVKIIPEKADNRPLKLICFLLPIKVSREFDLLLCIHYAYICRWIRNLKETFLWSIITWPTLGKQNIQFQVVCWETVLSSTDLIHLRKRQRYVMHNVYLNSPFVVMSDSKLKFESLSGYDRCCRYLTILRAP